MPFQNLDAVAFIDEPPEIFCEAGLFHVRQRFSATCTIERVMRPPVMFKAFQRAAQAIQDYHASEGSEPDDSAVLQFPHAS